MPFSKENRRYLVMATAIIAIFMISSALIAVIVLAGERPGHSPASSPTVYIAAVTAFAGLSINQFFIMLRAEMDRRETDQSRAVLHEKTDRILANTSEVKTAVVETPLIPAAASPLTEERVRTIISSTVEATVARVAAEAADRTIEELRNRLRAKRKEKADEQPHQQVVAPPELRRVDNPGDEG